MTINKQNNPSNPRPCPLCGSQKRRQVAIPDGFSVVRCSTCNMVYSAISEEFALAFNQNTDPTTLVAYCQNEPIETIAFYDRIIRNVIHYFGTTDVKILEFGCGSGMFMRRCHKAGLTVKGIDHSGYARTAGKVFNLDIFYGALVEAPFKDEEFDLVFSHATLEHVVKPLDEAERLISLLRPGGLFLTTGVPNFNTFTIRVLGNFWNNGPPGHLNFFETRTIEKMYQKLGLANIKTWTYGFNIWYLLRQFKALHRRLRKDNLKTLPLKEIQTLDPGSMEAEVIELVKRLDRNLEELEVPWSRRLIALFYSWARFPNAGSCVCARGVKPPRAKNN